MLLKLGIRGCLVGTFQASVKSKSDEPACFINSHVVGLVDAPSDRSVGTIRGGCMRMGESDPSSWDENQDVCGLDTY